jgi:hypothetical protein
VALHESSFSTTFLTRSRNSIPEPVYRARFKDHHTAARVPFDFQIEFCHCQFTRLEGFERLKMRFTSHVALGLLASTLSNALPTPQDEPSADSLPTSASSDVSEASKQLAELLAFAQSAANATLEENSSKAKRGGCTLSNVSVRKEWYAFGPFRVNVFGICLDTTTRIHFGTDTNRHLL